jgi:hypothetical protein
MKPSLKTAALLAAVAASAAGCMNETGSAPAQAAPQAMLEQPDHMMSTMAMHGIPVVNNYNQPWGVVQDVVIPPSGEPMVVVDVSKMVGHSKMVLVPLSHMQMANGHAMMRGADAKMAESLPAFPYSTAILNGVAG